MTKTAVAEAAPEKDEVPEIRARPQAVGYDKADYTVILDDSWR